MEALGLVLEMSGVDLVALVHVTLLEDDCAGVFGGGGSNLFGDSKGTCSPPPSGGVTCHVWDRHHGGADLTEIWVSGHGFVDPVMAVGEGRGLGFNGFGEGRFEVRGGNE